MVSTLIVSPPSGSTVDASKDMTVTLKTRNLVTGFFNDPATQYYLVPQTLDPKTGFIQGHQHVSIQSIGAGNAAPDAQTFAFFKGLNDAAPDGQTLSVVVPAGSLTINGQHRICTITGTDGHQPVIMPVAQRGSQDDCIRVNVANAGKVANIKGAQLNQAETDANTKKVESKVAII